MSALNSPRFMASGTPARPHDAHQTYERAIPVILSMRRPSGGCGRKLWPPTTTPRRTTCGPIDDMRRGEGEGEGARRKGTVSFPLFLRTFLRRRRRLRRVRKYLSSSSSSRSPSLIICYYSCRPLIPPSFLVLASFLLLLLIRSIITYHNTPL